MDIYEILNENAIKLSDTSEGTKKTKCPQFQPPHNAKDRPLSVTISSEGVVWKCHHCEWTGGRRTGGIYRPIPKPSYKRPDPPEVKKSNTSVLQTYFKDRGISRETYVKFKVF